MADTEQQYQNTMDTANDVGVAVPDNSAGIDPTNASEAAQRSKKDCRVYVGNLSYDVKWNILKDFMREAGNVVFSEVLSLPNGMSKGCGIVEYTTPEEAQRAIKELSDTPLLGRPVFIREDREQEARYGAPASAGRGGFAGGRGGFGGGYGGRGGFGGGFGGRGGYGGGYGGAPGGFGGGYGAPAGAPGAQLYIGNLPFQAGWQELKDLFRTAGNIVRADINMGFDGRPKGSGIVVFATPEDAQNAIQMYNGFDWNGRIIEVREDKFAGGGGPGGYGGGRGGYGGGFGGPRGGFGGGYGGGFGGPRGGFGGGYGGRGGFGGPGGYGMPPHGGAGGYQAAMPPADPSTQIFVKNLPWSTSNEDLVELFQTTGKVDEAEILFEGGRSKGVGVVQFASVEEAETAIQKFTNYVYGGRALDIEFNRNWRDFEGLRNRGVGAPGAPTGPAAASAGAAPPAAE